MPASKPDCPACFIDVHNDKPGNVRWPLAPLSLLVVVGIIASAFGAEMLFSIHARTLLWLLVVGVAAELLLWALFPPTYFYRDANGTVHAHLNLWFSSLDRRDAKGAVLRLYGGWLRPSRLFFPKESGYGYLRVSKVYADKVRIEFDNGDASLTLPIPLALEFLAQFRFILSSSALTTILRDKNVVPGTVHLCAAFETLIVKHEELLKNYEEAKAGFEPRLSELTQRYETKVRQCEWLGRGILSLSTLIRLSSDNSASEKVRPYRHKGTIRRELEQMLEELPGDDADALRAKWHANLEGFEGAEAPPETLHA